VVARFRGIGRGRKTRRHLQSGGSGPAQRLNDALADWADVRITPMFGRWGYFLGAELFGCFPVREKERDLWIRLPREAQARALAERGVRPHRRFGKRGWIELDVDTPADLDRALRWLRHAYVALRRGPPNSEDR